MTFDGAFDLVDVFAIVQSCISALLNFLSFTKEGLIKLDSADPLILGGVLTCVE